MESTFYSPNKWNNQSTIEAKEANMTFGPGHMSRFKVASGVGKDQNKTIDMDYDSELSNLRAMIVQVHAADSLFKNNKKDNSKYNKR